MRDFYTKENMQGEAFHVPDAGLVFEPDRLAFEVETGAGREGMIRVRHRAGKPARGYVYPSGPNMRGVREQFAPAADGTGYIRWQFDARGLAPGRTVRGCFRIISPFGEYSIPYTVEISGKGQLLRKRQSGGQGPETGEPAAPQIGSKEEFAALAGRDFAGAASFFYSSRMEDILVFEEDRTLYRGLSMQEGNLRNVEEFLITACGKEKALFLPEEKSLTLETRAGAGRAEGRMAGTRAERALEAHRERVRTNGLGGEPARREKSREEDLVYISLRIRQIGKCAVGPVIRAEGRFLPADPFVVPIDEEPGTGPLNAGQAPAEGEAPEKIYTVRIPVNRAALHAGRNLGRLTVQGPFNETELPVEVHCRSNAVEMRRRQEKELELLELQLMRLYVDLRLEDKRPEGWFLQMDRLIDEIAVRSHRDLIPRLYGVHLLILRGQKAEAQRELGRIALRFSGSDEPQNLTARFTKESETAYSYRQYLQAKCREDDAQLRGRVVRYLRGLYRQTGSWRTAWMLLDLSEEYAPGTGARWNFLRHQFESGCNSPVIWVEAWDMVREDPRILLPGSSVQERWARDDFGLHVLWYAARNRVLTERAAEIMIALAEKKKAFSGLLYRGLCAAWEMYGERSARDPEESGTGAEDSAHVEGSGPDAEVSAPAERSGSGAEDPEHTAPNGGLPEGGPDRVRRDLLRAICMQLVRGQDLSAPAHKWYTRGLEAGIGLTRLEENWRQSMPEDDSEYRVPRGRNAILRTTAKRAERAVLIYDRFRREDVFPVRDGIAFLPVYGNANTVFLEDRDGNRYAGSLPYALDIREEEKAAGPDPSGRIEGGEDPHALAARIGFGERGEIRLPDEGQEPDQDLVRSAGLLLDSGLLTAPAATELLLACLSAWSRPEVRRFFLAKADPSRCTPREREELYARLAETGAYEQAYQWMAAYGTGEMDPQLLARLCLAIPWEGGALPLLVEASWEAFARGNTDPGLLERLCAFFTGLSGELLRLRKACADRGLPTRDLDERILRQALYSGVMEQDHARILIESGKRTGEVFLPAVARYADHAFSNGVPMGNRMTDLIAGLVSGENSSGDTGGEKDRGEVADICRIACLKELSMRQGEISQRERAAARASLSVLLSKGIIFPFYRQFPGYDDRLDLYAEETLVQYHPAEPDDGRGRNIMFHYTTSRRGEAGNYRARPMKEMYRDFYVSGFLLFYGEQMRYYITDDAAGKHVVQSGTIGQDARILESCSGRFGLINETTKAAALREYDEALSLLTGYYRRSYLEDELFRR